MGDGHRSICSLVHTHVFLEGEAGQGHCKICYNTDPNDCLKKNQRGVGVARALVADADTLKIGTIFGGIVGGPLFRGRYGTVGRFVLTKRGNEWHVTAEAESSYGATRILRALNLLDLAAEMDKMVNGE